MIPAPGLVPPPLRLGGRSQDGREKRDGVDEGADRRKRERHTDENAKEGKTQKTRLDQTEVICHA